jgi:hypothetical protein
MAVTPLCRIVVGLALMILLEPGRSPQQAGAATGDLAFLRSWFEVSDTDRDVLKQGGVVTRGLPASGQHIGVVAACAVDISAEAFLVRTGSLGYLKRDQLIGRRFGDPPSLGDLGDLTLEQGDIDRLRQCRRGACALNLAEHEMSALRSALSAPAGSKPDVQDAFRHAVLERVRRYQSQGMGALPEYQDRQVPVRPAAVFSELLLQTPSFHRHIPALAEYLEQFPAAHTAGASSFFHWSKVVMNGKPVVLVAHFTTFRPERGAGVPTVVLAAKQIYASRYMNGELALWMLFVGDAPPNYLVYLHRSHLDALGGTLTSVKRTVLERGITQEVADTMASLRDQLQHRP